MSNEAFSWPGVHFGMRNQRAAHSLSDTHIETFQYLSFWDVMRTRHNFDAHFVCYQCIDPQDGPELTMPRLAKSLLPEIQVNGGSVRQTIMALDWDTPGHVPLTRDLFGEFYASLLAAATQENPLLHAIQWHLLYSTRNGARMIFVLREPVSVDDSESRLRGLVHEFRSRNILVDDRACDWTRVFRLPYVLREGRRTWQDDNPPVEFIEQPDAPLLDAMTLPSVAGGLSGRLGSTASVPLNTQPFDGAQPSDETAEALIKIPFTSKYTDFAKRARKTLQGRNCLPCIYEEQELAPEGERDDTLVRYVGEAIAYLIGAQSDCTPEHIYGLFLAPIKLLTPDAGTPDWRAKLWDVVGRIWSQECAKREVIETRRSQDFVQQLDLTDRLLNQMRTWPTVNGHVHPSMSIGDRDASRAFLKRHLIASTGGTAGLFLLESDVPDSMGYYRPFPITDKQLVAAIRNSSLRELIPTTRMSGKSGEAVPQDRKAQDIINEHATVVREIWVEPGEGAGGFIDMPDQSGAILRVRGFSRNSDLEEQACPNMQVDEWLHAFFGENYNLACRWIAWSLAFEDGIICALSIKGPAGSGKKMLTVGLSECLRHPHLATSKDLVGEFNDAQLTSPFLVVDEGWAQEGRGRHPADQFRAMVSGDPFTVNQKFQAPVKVTCGVRIIMTGNNHSIIQQLTQGRELSPEDREALATRLLHFDIDRTAAEWLTERGGMALTARDGARWIRGDGGQPSDFVLARHFLWMYKHRRDYGAPGTRFLVTGNASREILFDLRTQTGNSPLVIEAIVMMLESPGVFDGLAVQGVSGVPRLFALPADVLSFYRANMRDRIGDRLTLNSVSNALRGIAAAESAPAGFILPERPFMGSRRWVELDCELLLQVAERDGWKCDKLKQLVDERIAAGALVVETGNDGGVHVG